MRPGPIPSFPGTSAGDATVLVAIPTFRRPDWAGALLDALDAALRGCPGARVVLLDNDPAGPADGLARHPVLDGPGREYRHVGLGDVASVRNAALDLATECGVTWLAMLDDDELPPPGWLQELLRVAAETGADVVGGPVRQEADALDSPWVAAALGRAEHPEGPLAQGDLGTGNVLVSMALVTRCALRFDSSLGRSGGEDTLFFRRARRCGARFAWAPGAAVVERNQPGRLTRRALTRRLHGNGRSSVVIDRVLDGDRSSIRRRATSAIALIHAGASAILALARRDRAEAWRQWFRAARHVGRLRGAPHGRPLDGGYGA